MKISDVCKEFFTGFNDLHASVKNDDAKTFVSGALKVCAYCTFILPAVVGFAYAADVIVRRYHLDQKALELGQRISSAALPHFQQFGKKIEEKAEIARAEALAFAKARYQDIVNFKDELMGNPRSRAAVPASLEEGIATWVANFGGDEFQSERLAYILSVLENPRYQANPGEYVRQWAARGGSGQNYLMVESFALTYFQEFPLKGLPFPLIRN